MIFVHEMMTREPMCILPETSPADASRLLVAKRLHGAPVAGNAGPLVGVVSLLDLATAREQTLDGVPATVADVMSRDAITIAPGEGIYEAARSMVRHGIHRLVVVDEDRRPIGILTPMDILTGLVNLESGFQLRERHVQEE